MDKKMVCGVLLTVIGLVFSIFALAYASMHPWDYNGIDGLLGSLLGTQMLTPLILSMTAMLAGLGIAFGVRIEKKNKSAKAAVKSSKFTEKTIATSE